MAIRSAPEFVGRVVVPEPIPELTNGSVIGMEYLPGPKLEALGRTCPLGWSSAKGLACGLVRGAGNVRSFAWKAGGSWRPGPFRSSGSDFSRCGVSRADLAELGHSGPRPPRINSGTDVGDKEERLWFVSERSVCTLGLVPNCCQQGRGVGQV